MIKYFLVTIFLILFTGCVSTNSPFVLNSEKMILGKKDSLSQVNFTNPKMKTFPSFCTIDSYTISDENKEYGYLFIESIEVVNGCNWTGLPSGFFESNFKDSLKISSMKTVEEFDINGYAFKTLHVNNDSYINMIYIYVGVKDTFILDTNGKLYDKLIKTFKPNYVNNYLDKKRFINHFEDSLVRKNLINHYFEDERIKLLPSNN